MAGFLQQREEYEQDDFGDYILDDDAQGNDGETIRQMIVEDTALLQKRNISFKRDIPYKTKDDYEPQEYATVSDGTPVGALVKLASKCKEILEDYGYDKGYIKTLDGLIQLLKRLKREDLDKGPPVISSLNELVNKTIVFIEQNKKKNPGIEAELIKMWSCILLKGMSDITQYGSTLKLLNSNTMYSKFLPESIKQYHEGESLMSFFKKTCSILQIPRVVGVSSDKIAAALMTNVSVLYGDSSPPILCTRKRQMGTAYIILQNYKVAYLAHLISECNAEMDEDCMFRAFKGIKAEFCYDDEREQLLVTEDRIQEKFDEFFRCKERMIPFSKGKPSNNMFFETVQDILGNHVRGSPRYDKWRELNEYENVQFKLQKMIVFIRAITKEVTANIDAFNESAHQFWEDENSEEIEDEIEYKSHRYAYTVATIVFQLLYPFNPDSVPFETLCRAEFISGTNDARKGHDFKNVSCVKKLGDKFLNLLGIEIDDNREEDENDTIIGVLYKNKMATICQTDNEFVYSFKSSNTFLTSEEYPLPKQNLDWLLFACPLSFSPLFAAIDFTRGVPQHSQHKFELINFFLKQMPSNTDLRKHELFRITFPQKVVDHIKSLIGNDFNNFFEIFTANSFYDGAAPFGARPLQLMGPCSSYIHFPKNNYTLIMRTYTKKKYGLEQYVKNNLKSGNTVNNTPLTGVLERFHNNTKRLVERGNEFIVRFDQIWKRPHMNLSSFTIPMYKGLLYAFTHKNNKFIQNFCLQNADIGCDVFTMKKQPSSLAECKEAFDKIMYNMLNFMLANHSAESINKLLDIFERIVEYQVHSNPQFLGNTGRIKETQPKGKTQRREKTYIGQVYPKLIRPTTMLRQRDRVDFTQKMNKGQKVVKEKKTITEYDASDEDSDKERGARVTKKRKSNKSDALISIKNELIRRYGEEQGTDYMEWFIQWNNGEVSTPEGLGNVFQELQARFLPISPANKQSGKTKKRGRSSSESPSSAAAAAKKGKILGPEDFGV